VSEYSTEGRNSWVNAGVGHHDCDIGGGQFLNGMRPPPGRAVWILTNSRYALIVELTALPSNAAHSVAQNQSTLQLPH